MEAKSLNSIPCPTMDLSQKENGLSKSFQRLSFLDGRTTSFSGLMLAKQARKSNKWLSKMFDGKVGWVHRKEVSFISALVVLF